MSYEATGKLYKIFDTAQVSDRFQRRDFVLEIEDGQYPQLIKFQAVQDRCKMLDDFGEGEQVKVSFDLRGREYNGQKGLVYFTNLNAWRVEKLDGSNAAPQQSGGFDDSGFPTAADAPAPSNTNSGGDSLDDLPF